MTTEPPANSETPDNTLPPITDSHAHLDSNRFRRDRREVIKRAREVGITGIIQIGSSPESWQPSIDIAFDYPGFIRAVLGIQPHDSEKVVPELLSELRRILERNRGRIAGIGECGLDYHYDMPRDRQREVFAEQLRLAGELSLPVVVHSRDAEKDTIDLLAAEADLRGEPVSGVMHCFSGGVQFAEKCIEQGLEISFSGIVTFKNAEDIRSAAAFVQNDKIHVETDSPYLAPVPYRGRRCEPAWVRATAEFIAGLRGERIEDFCRRCVRNTARLFNAPDFAGASSIRLK